MREGRIALLTLFPVLRFGICLQGEIHRHSCCDGAEPSGRNASNRTNHHLSLDVPHAATTALRGSGRHLVARRTSNGSTRAFYDLHVRHVTQLSRRGRFSLDEGLEFVMVSGSTIGVVFGVLMILLCLVSLYGALDEELQSHKSNSRSFNEHTSYGGSATYRREGVRQPPPTIMVTPPPKEDSIPPFIGHYGGYGYFSDHSYVSDSNVDSDRMSSKGEVCVPKPKLDPSKPSPICPELLLVTESSFSVAFENIDRAAESVPIYGRRGQCLFTARIQKLAPGIGSVTLVFGDSQGQRLGILTSSGTGSLSIEDRRRRPHAELISVGDLAYSLRWGNIDMMRFTTDHANGRVSLTNPHDGTNLASASRLHDTSNLPSREDHLGIHIVAGMDPALTILCVIGAMVFSF